MLERAPAAYAPLLPRLFVAVYDDGEGSFTGEGEEIVSRARGALRRWGPEAVWPLLDAIAGAGGAGSYASELLVDACEWFDEVRDELRRRMAGDPHLAAVARRVERPTPSEALARMRYHLLEEILPADWNRHQP